MEGLRVRGEFPDDFDDDPSRGGVFDDDDLLSATEFPGENEMRMSYSDWSGGLDSGTSWLPAYGFQQPALIQEALMTHDSYDGNQGYMYLETIMEETSDDLRSESDYSGWQDSDSGSVIHIPNKLACLSLNLPVECNDGDWSGSERDVAVPKKRRRRAEDGSEEDGSSRVSRSSSLLQFETLEKHCEHSFSYDSLEAARWARYSDSLESSSSEDNVARSFSSSSFRSGLRSSRSYDSLVTLDRPEQPLSGEFSQSLQDTSVPLLDSDPEPLPPPGAMYQTVECLDRVGAGPRPRKGKRSSENLSEDSGFGEHIPSKAADPWAKYSAGWQSAPDLASRPADAQLARSLLQFALRDDEEPLIVPENKFVMESKVPASSTPNLSREPPAPDDLLKFDSTVSLSRAHSFKKTFETEGMFAKAPSRGSNIQITTSFVSLGSPPSFTFYEEAAVCSGLEEAARATGGGDSPDPPVGVSQADVHFPSRTSDMETAKSKRHTGIGGFFQRFSLRRLSGKDKKRKEKKKEAIAAKSVPSSPPPEDELVRIIPLHGPDPASKPPLPPRRREASPAPAASEPTPIPASVMSTRTPVGLLETDIDSDTTSCSPGKKARSLLSLGQAGPQPPQPPSSPDNRAKSMEFLLDKENHQQVQPPENELQKVGERVMSEHELRVQRSLQRLDLPEWYRNWTPPAQGFLLGKRPSDAAHWPGLRSKTTSLSSLGSTHSAAPTPRSPTTGHLLSPSSTGFTRWSTSRLNTSATTSTSTSPSGSARSSFNYRQPYLGWRSQERITRPRTPAERLAAGLLPLKQQHQNVPNLSEVHSSIKEVTSAIASYVSKDDRLSPAFKRHDPASSRSNSPRGSKTQLCWLESSFVGCKPLEVPETPLSANPPKASDLRLDLTPATPAMKPVNDALQ